MAQRSRDLLLDGEVVAYDGDQTSFTRLQQRLGAARPSPEQVAKYPVVYCVFDLLELDGKDLTDRPLVERRAQLIKAIRSSTALQHTEAWRDDSEGRFAAACRSGWEGLIAKRADAPYVAGRSKFWLKLKCVWEQEFVVGGYTDPTGSRTDFGALLVGYYEQGSLRYAGKVGTGYTKATLRGLGVRLRKLETATPPFVDARRSLAACIGRGPSSSLRSVLPSGRATLGCGNRGFSGSGTTRARLMSYGSAPSEQGMPSFSAESTYFVCSSRWIGSAGCAVV